MQGLVTRVWMCRIFSGRWRNRSGAHEQADTMVDQVFPPNAFVRAAQGRLAVSICMVHPEH
jgi:hypothetical protein